MTDASHGIGRRSLLQGLGGAAAALSLPGCVTPLRAAARRPNIIFIMTDDHAQSALSSYGNSILKTPNLDRIGAEGVRFTEAFVTNSLCLPSRATYLTGLYSHTHGLMTNGEESGFMNEPRLDNAATWPSHLRAAGYHTGVVGKWHVNTPPAGYDYTAVLPGQGMYFDPPMLVQGRETRGKGHTDDVIGQEALGFLDRRPADRPFALLYQFKAPHRGWEPAPRFARAFADIEIPPPPDLYETLAGKPLALRLSDMRLADMNDYRSRGVRADMPEEERARLNWQHFIKDYYRVLLGVDENVGQAARLSRPHRAEREHVDRLHQRQRLLPRRERAVRQAADVRAVDPRADAGPPPRLDPAGPSQPRAYALNVDVAPTFLDAGQASAVPAMQGRSWMPIAQGRRAGGWRKDFLYEYFEFPAAHCVRRHRGVRTRRWKLIEWDYPAAWELYDLAADPREKRNLAGRPEHAAQEARLTARLAELRRELGDRDYPAGDPADLRHCAPVRG